LLLAAAYLLLLAAAEPHRVHHSFDLHAKPSCPVYALAKGCHAQAVAPPTAEHSSTFIAIVLAIPDLWTPRALPAPATQRAPPSA
jgi:hypothetical protein